jgi:hypothetical protein
VSDELQVAGYGFAIALLRWRAETEQDEALARNHSNERSFHMLPRGCGSREAANVKAALRKARDVQANFDAPIYYLDV